MTIFNPICMGCREVFLARDTVAETKAALLAAGWGWYDGENVKLLYCIECRHIPKPRPNRSLPLQDQESLF